MPQLFALAVLVLVPLIAAVAAQDLDPGKRVFESHCARCHGADGNGGEMGPPILFRLPVRDDQQLAALVHEGLPARGMPPSDVAGEELSALLKFLRTIQQRPEAKPVVRVTVQTVAGRTIAGQVLGEGFDDLGGGS